MFTVEVLWSRWMGLPTTSGRSQALVLFKRIARNGLKLALVPTLVSCTGLALAKQDQPTPATTVDFSSAIRSREAENATLRVALAGAKIDVTRKDAEVQELQLAITKLQQETVQTRKILDDMRTAAESGKVEAASLRVERDQLLRAKAELQAQANEVTGLRARIAQTTTFETGVQNQMRDLKESVSQLTAQLEQVKQDLQRTLQPPAPAAKSRGGKTGPQKQKLGPSVSPILPSSGSHAQELDLGRVRARPIQGSPSESWELKSAR